MARAQLLRGAAFNGRRHPGETFGCGLPDSLIPVDWRRGDRTLSDGLPNLSCVFLSCYRRDTAGNFEIGGRGGGPEGLLRGATAVPREPGPDGRVWAGGDGCDGRGGFLVCPAFAANPRACPVILAMSPAVVLMAVMSAFRGYFQGWQEMRPSGLSQLYEQVVRVVVLLFLAILLLPHGVEWAAVGAALVLLPAPWRVWPTYTGAIAGSKRACPSRQSRPGGARLFLGKGACFAWLCPLLRPQL